MSCYRVLVLSVLLTVLLSGSVLAQDSLNVHTVGFLALPGYSKDLALDGHYALVAGATESGSGFSMVDIQRLDSMTLVGVFDPNPPEGGSMSDIAISGNYAYATDWFGRVRTVYIADTANLLETNMQRWNRVTGKSAMANGHLFVPSYEGLHILSLATPSVPVEVALYDSNRVVEGVAATGNRLYVIENSRVKALDIIDPASPQLLGSYSDLSAANYGIMALDGNHVFMVAIISMEQTELRDLDFSNPETPVLLGRFVQPFEAPHGLACTVSLVYFTSADGFIRVIDVSDSTNPREVGHYRPSSSATYGMATDEGNVFLAESDGIRILHFDRPQNTQPTKSVSHEFALHPVYPNPLNSSTRIGFSLPKREMIELTLYDVLGRKLRDITKDVYPQGKSEVVFNASGLTSGTYFIRLIPPGTPASQKIIVIK